MGIQVGGGKSLRFSPLGWPFFHFIYARAPVERQHRLCARKVEACRRAGAENGRVVDANANAEKEREQWWGREGGGWGAEESRESFAVDSERVLCRKGKLCAVVPHRCRHAAKLQRSGWAPSVSVVRRAPSSSSKAERSEHSCGWKLDKGLRSRAPRRRAERTARSRKRKRQRESGARRGRQNKQQASGGEKEGEREKGGSERNRRLGCAKNKVVETRKARRAERGETVRRGGREQGSGRRSKTVRSGDRGRGANEDREWGWAGAHEGSWAKVGQPHQTVRVRHWV